MCQSNTNCDGTFSLKYSKTVSSFSEQSIHTSQFNELHDRDHKQGSNCDDGTSTCRNCHLGHCAFTLGKVFQVIALTQDEKLIIDDVSVIIIDFQTSLFRPPIV